MTQSFKRFLCFSFVVLLLFTALPFHSVSEAVQENGEAAKLPNGEKGLALREAEGPWRTGTLGENVIWEYYSIIRAGDINKTDGLLIIKPGRDGEKKAVLNPNDTSWQQFLHGDPDNPHSVGHQGEITTVSFEDGVYSGESGCSYLFSGFTGLQKADLSHLDTSEATSLASMFSNCSALPQVDLSGLDLSKVDSMSNLFYGCVSLKEVRLPANMNRVGDMGGCLY